ALWLQFVDVQLLPAGADPPIDAADAVAGLKGPDVGELDAVALLAGDVVAGVDLILGRRERSPQAFGRRINAQPVGSRRPALLVAEETERIPRADSHVRQHIGTPMRAPHRESQAPGLPRSQLDRQRWAVGLQAGWEVEAEVDLADRRGRQELEGEQ